MAIKKLVLLHSNDLHGDYLPEIRDGVPIVQVGTGTDQIGHFEIEYDTFWQTIKSWSWGCVPITEKTAPWPYFSNKTC